MHRLRVEIREAKRLADTSENPETSSFWRSHARDLQAKFDALQRNVETSARTMHFQTTAENPAEQPKGLQSKNLVVQQGGDYYAMEENNTYRHYNVDSAQSQMQAMEYESRMVDVIAPADLPGGYHFEAEIEGQRFLATVPAGGVQQGETFTCYMRELNSVAIDIPVGYWKDNMCHMCKHGLCHPTLWHGLFCPLSKWFILRSWGWARIDRQMFLTVSSLTHSRSWADYPQIATRLSGTAKIPRNRAKILEPVHYAIRDSFVGSAQCWFDLRWQLQVDAGYGYHGC